MKRRERLLTMWSVMAGVALLTGALFAQPPQAANHRDDTDIEDTSPDTPLPPGITERVFIHMPRTHQPNHLGTCTTTTNDQVNDYGLAGWHLPVGGIHWKLNASTVPSSVGAQAQAVLSSAFETWNDADPEKIFTYDGTTSINRSRLDYVNVVLWGKVSAGAIGITYIRYYTATGLVADVDTVFNSRYPWAVFDPSNGECQSKPDAYDVRNIATHEFGHWIGLDDLYNIADKDLTMYGYGAGGELKKSTLGTGDLSGAVAVAP